MPTGVTGIVRARKAHRKTAEVRTAAPTPFCDELVESRLGGYNEELSHGGHNERLDYQQTVT